MSQRKAARKIGILKNHNKIVLHNSELKLKFYIIVIDLTHFVPSITIPALHILKKRGDHFMEPRKDINNNNTPTSTQRENNAALLALPSDVKKLIVDEIKLDSDLVFFSRSSKKTLAMCADRLDKLKCERSQWIGEINSIIVSFMMETSALSPADRFDGTSISKLNNNDLISYHNNLAHLVKIENTLIIEDSLQNKVVQLEQCEKVNYNPWNHFPLFDFFTGWKNQNDPFPYAKTKGNQQAVNQNNQVRTAQNITGQNVNNNAQAISKSPVKPSLFIPIRTALWKGYDLLVHRYIQHYPVNPDKMNDYLEDAISGGNAECIKIILIYMRDNDIKIAKRAEYYLELLLTNKTTGVIATTKQACFQVMEAFLDIKKALDYKHVLQAATYEQKLPSRFSDGITQLIYNDLLKNEKHLSPTLIDESLTNHIQTFKFLSHLMWVAQKDQNQALLEFLSIQTHEGKLESETLIQTFLRDNLKMRKQTVSEDKRHDINNSNNNNVTPTLKRT